MRILIQLYFNALKFFLVFCLISIVCLIFLNVVLRYGFNSGINISVELSRFLFVWMVFSGAIIVLHENGHVAVEALVRKLPRLGALSVVILAKLCMIFVGVLLLDGSWKQMMLNWSTLSPTVGMPMGYFYLTGVIFSVLSIWVQIIASFEVVLKYSRGGEVLKNEERQL
ncbi:TRAP transporter small permease [Halomonas sp. MCCC 1A11036]|uniref:TRAP transporter small permease protein n=1 Tax=Billgrantia zhangzhouensis TaxID=2733481 RepID=A0ABS9A9J7_9GAMM|nr:TRAP transporter small permease [Halomonas zhangzhouensis]MCE8018591.1 TRAP transporter small permease [Halomonas zhangzhouensis]